MTSSSNRRQRLGRVSAGPIASAASAGPVASAPAAAADSGVWLTAGSAVRVSAAGRQDLATAADILDEASAWLESRGLSGWPRPFPTDQLVADLARGATYLAWDGSSAIGTFSLYRTDVSFWGERDDEPPGHARYLHKLAVRRGHPGLGRELIDVAEAIARSEGATCLRLDCVRRERDLRGYYEAGGFEYRGEVDEPGLMAQYAILEKRLR